MYDGFRKLTMKIFKFGRDLFSSYRDIVGDGVRIGDEIGDGFMLLIVGELGIDVGSNVGSNVVGVFRICVCEVYGGVGW
ncbi:hypothetical protein Tco_0418634 [Tanacetum coccineum]